MTAPPVAIGAEGSDGQLWVQAPQLSPGWQPMGGHIVAPPAVVAPPNPAGSTLAQPLFIGTGTDRQLYIRSLAAGWQLLGQKTACIGLAGAVITGTAAAGYTLTVACRGTDSALWENSAALPASGLPQFTAGWTRLGGALTAGPAVAPVGGTLMFFALGTTGRVYTRTLTTGFAEHPWGCIGAPAASLLAEDDTTYFACQGTNHALWYAASSGAAWTPAASLGGSLIGGPAVAATSDFIGLLAEGTDHAVWGRTTAITWTRLGGSAVGGVGAAALN